MTHSIDTLRAEALEQLNKADDLAALDGWHTAVLGRKGSLTNLLGAIGSLPREERPAKGQRANELKRALEAAHEATLATLKERALAGALRNIAGRPAAERRKVMTDILYVLRTGCQWSAWPRAYGPGKAAHSYFQR